MEQLRVLVGLGLLVLCSSFSNIATANEYQIEQVKDNVYRFTAGHYHSVFLVTDAGIFITDPINPDAAAYLKAELAKRFDKPIKYMAYSHNHVDHTLGGKIFATDNVDVIAHQYAAQDLEWTQTPTALPTITFKQDLRIGLGSSQVHLKYHGPNNGRGSVSMHFMPANVMYVVDWIVLGRMPYQNLPGYDIHGMIQSTREILAGPDFDVFVGGHAGMGSRTDVAEYLGYLEALYTKVRDGMLAGKDLATLQQEIELSDYAHLKMYNEWLSLNIEGVYRTLNDMSYFNLRESDLPAGESN